MKLSEILKDWPVKRKETEPYNQYANIQFNTAIDACDQEIDREALAKHISNALCDCKEDHITGERSRCRYCYDIEGYEKELADYIISTMPTWLKPTERK